MDRREELIANILKHVTITQKQDAQGQAWNVVKIRKDMGDELLYETQLISGAGVIQLGSDLYTDIAALKLFDEYQQEQETPKIKTVPRIKRVK